MFALSNLFSVAGQSKVWTLFSQPNPNPNWPFPQPRSAVVVSSFPTFLMLIDSSRQLMERTLHYARDLERIV